MVYNKKNDICCNKVGFYTEFIIILLKNEGN